MSPLQRIPPNQDDVGQEDVIDVILAHQYRLILADAPRQSGFRVIAVIFYEKNKGGRDDDADSQPALATTCTNCLGALENQSNASVQRILKLHRNPHGQNRKYVVGTNDEPHAISGSICAERAALVQLRFLPKDVRVTKIVIVTDSPSEISPGMLCREFMSSHPRISPDTPILLGGGICANCGLDISSSEATDVLTEQLVDCCKERLQIKADEVTAQKKNDMSAMHHDFTRNRTTVRDLYPHPSLYARFNVAEAVKFGKMFASSKPEPSFCPEHSTQRSLEKEKIDDSIKEGKVPNAMALNLLKLATNASRLDNRPDVHPLQYGAAVLFSDGTFATSHQKKALEYGCTLDAVGQLAHVIEEKCSRNDDGNLTQYDKLCKDPNDGTFVVKGKDSQTPIENTVVTKEVRPVLLVHADQYGIAHAPFARGRAYLSEHGYRDCHVLVHSPNVGNDDREKSCSAELKLLQVRVDHLVPDIPDMGGGILNCMCNESPFS